MKWKRFNDANPHVPTRLRTSSFSLMSESCGIVFNKSYVFVAETGRLVVFFRGGCSVFQTESNDQVLETISGYNKMKCIV